MSLRKTAAFIIALTFVGLLALILISVRSTLRAHLEEGDVRDASMDVFRASGILQASLDSLHQIAQSGGAIDSALPDSIDPGPIREALLTAENSAGWLVVDGSIWQVAQGPERLLARRWTNDDEGVIASKYKLETQLHVRGDGSALGDDAAYALSVLDQGAPTYSIPSDAYTTTTYLLLDDIYGESSILMTIQTPRTGSLTGQFILDYLLMVLAAGISIFAVMNWLLMGSLVLSPVLRLNREVNQITTSANPSLRVTVSKNKDEIAHLSQNINAMLASLAEAQAQVRAADERFTRGMVEVQEAEQRALAQELHDEIGQVLTGLQLMLTRAETLPEDEMRQQVIDARLTVGSLMDRVRQISLDLRPTLLDDLGLVPALRWLFERIQQQTGVQVDFTQVGMEGQRFSPEIETTLYRIVQEALTNVARHARTTHASVAIWQRAGRIGLQVEDEGVGFIPDGDHMSGSTLGLQGMRQRVLHLKGTFNLDSAPDEGTRLMVEIPLAGKGTAHD